VLIYHYNGYIYGLQFRYRDSFGIRDKEVFKGGLHLPKVYNQNQFSVAKLTLANDETIGEVYLDGYEYISYVKMVTNKKKVLEVGQQITQGKLESLVPFGSKLNAVGGILSGCVNALYFYYV